MGRKPLSAAQRREKVNSILSYADSMVRSRGYDGVRINDIASSAGMAKSTLFLYFSGKEELFLSVFGDQLRRWFSDLAARVDAVIDESRQTDVEAFLSALRDSLISHPHAPAAFMDLGLKVAPGLSGENLEKFHLLHSELMDSGGGLLEGMFPYLEARAGLGIFSRLLSLLLVIGGYGGVWGEYCRRADEGPRDPVMKEYPWLRPDTATMNDDGRAAIPGPALDFYIQSVRRILKGYSLQ